MPSPRASPVIRPSSPLSYGSYYKPSSIQYEMLSSSTPRQPHPRPLHAQRGRVMNSTLQLPALPRFHPANYPSAHSSLSGTPDGTDLARPPPSPRTHQRLCKDVQKQLHSHQRDIFGAPISPMNQSHRPLGPRLAPLGSPGPVTPLMLEGEGGYLAAGVTGQAGLPTADLVEKIISNEVQKARSPAMEG